LLDCEKGYQWGCGTAIERIRVQSLIDIGQNPLPELFVIDRRIHGVRLAHCFPDERVFWGMNRLREIKHIGKQE
jgi:hypothetical protein